MYKKDLFYNNLPYTKGHTLKKLGYLKACLVERSFLQNVKNPYFIWTGTGRIKKLEKMILNFKTQNKLKKNPDVEFYFYLYEPLCARIEEYNRSFYSEFTSTVDLKKIISDELESIRIFVSNNDIKKFRIFTSDYNIQLIQENYPDLKLNCLDLFLREITPGYKYLPEYENKIIHKFWCGNWRYTTHRHLVTSYLSQLDGIYTWNLQCSYEKLKENNWFDIEHFKMKHFKKHQRLKEGVEFLNNYTLKIDQKLNPLTVDEYSKVYIPGDNAPQWTDEFLQSYKRCFCAIVNETRFAQPFGYFSEKTLTAINSRLPIILAAPPYTLEYLKTFGFKTFDRWWDESYDTEEDHYERIIKIFDVIDYINSKSIEELREIYTEMDEILDHNLKVIRTIPMNNIPF
jgi:hypothetical protein